jgi:hypothetical protein
MLISIYLFKGYYISTPPFDSKCDFTHRAISTLWFYPCFFCKTSKKFKRYTSFLIIIYIPYFFFPSLYTWRSWYIDFGCHSLEQCFTKIWSPSLTVTEGSFSLDPFHSFGRAQSPTVPHVAQSPSPMWRCPHELGEEQIQCAATWVGGRGSVVGGWGGRGRKEVGPTTIVGDGTTQRRAASMLYFCISGE